MLSNHSDDCVFYVDESGDLGFGPGSSRFFVIAVVCIDRSRQTELKRYVRRFREKLKLPRSIEMKAKSTKPVDRTKFCQGLAALPCSVHYLVANKSRVKPELRKDTNILYNYLTGLLLAPLMASLERAELRLDNRTIKVASGNSLHDYLRIKLWYEMNSPVNVTFAYVDSRECLGIQTADLAAHAVFRRYERADSASFEKLALLLGETREVFF